MDHRGVGKFMDSLFGIWFRTLDELDIWVCVWGRELKWWFCGGFVYFVSLGFGGRGGREGVEVSGVGV